MSKARGLANLGNVYNDGALSNRNLIINGAMQVWQRGTSFTSSGYTVDRWRAVSDTAIVAQKVEDTVDGRKVSVLQSVATSGHTYHAVLQRIEGMRRIQGQTLTLSAWVKGSAGVFTQYAEYRNAAGGVVSNSNFDFTFTGNWQKLEWTFTAPTNASYDSDAAWYDIAFYGGDSLSLTMVQLEVGDTATPFEHRSYGQELALCQRYYQVVHQRGNSAAGTYYSYYNRFYGNQLQFTPMRATPSAAFTIISGAFYWVNPGVDAYSASTTANFYFSAYQGENKWGSIEFSQTRTAGGATPGNGGAYRLEASIDFKLDAEL